jgi:hypothetical protein
MMRNSSAFGAWYDAGYALIRRGENAPVTVRTELRDAPTEPFAFTVEDEFPASPEYGPYPSGALRLLASDRSAERIQQEATAAKYRPLVIDFLRENPGCSKNQLEGGIQGDRNEIRAALRSLCQDRTARIDEPERPGKPARCWLHESTSLNLAATSLQRTSEDLADLAATPRRGVHGARSSECPRESSQRTPAEPDGKGEDLFGGVGEGSGA